MRILVIEDNKKTSSYLAKALQESFFSVDVAHDGVTGLHLATEFNYSVIILDIMLPQMDGFTLLDKIKSIKPSTPIIFLTAKDSIDDRVRGLNSGADDYLIKPFAFSELLARIQSILRRNTNQANTIIKILDLTIDMDKHKVHRNNKQIQLSAKEYMLLKLLALNTEKVLSRTYIAEQIWDMHFDCDTNIIDVAIKRLRDKIDKNFDRELIHAVRGVGYVLEDR
ncbi:MAG: heavy metal response regulator transcription factor [Legionellaceae bacterium]|nr:heavy metal response regulator transcription factor [Legionellaceae bacterium]